MFCGYCGGEIPSGAACCPYCGRPLGGPLPPPRRRFPWLVVLLALLAVAAVVMVILVINLPSHDVTSSAPETTAQNQIHTTDPPDSEPPETGTQPEPSVTSAPETSGPTDTTVPRAVTVEDVIGVYARKRFQYQDSVGNDYDISCTVPMFILNTPDARACNDAFLGDCASVLDELERSQEEETSPWTAGIHYEAWIYDGTVTLLVSVESMVDVDSYYVYTLDVDTGELVDGEDMALLCGMTFDQLKKTAQDALQAYFESLYKSAEQDDFYETQLERTLSPENLETVTFYRTETGALMMQATVYSLAGAQSYERMIPIPLD